MKKEDILATARKRFSVLQAESSENRDDALEDIKFTYNIDDAQWSEPERTKRIKAKRPYLTHNKIRKFVAQVANRERDQRLSQKVKPIDDKSDPIVADILTGYIHNIEYQSKADVIYTRASEQSLAGGFGYWRILTKYAHDSFDQEIQIKHIENPFSVYLHPSGTYGFIREAMTVEDFKTEYPDAEVSDFDAQSIGEEYTAWFEEDKVFIAEYFYKEPIEKTIAQVVMQGDLDGQPEIIELKDGITPEMLMAEGYQILKQRKVKCHTVKWCKITGSDIIEGWEKGKVRDWVGEEIPIIEVKGDEVNVAGKIIKRSLIRDGKDPQRMYNYWLSSMTEKVALSPKAPYIVTPEMIKGFETMWDEANEANYPYLLTHPTPQGFPQRQVPPPIDTGAMAMLNIGEKDIQDTLGMYDSSFGERSNERTGKAIIARSSRSDMGTYHFVDNLRRAIQDTARQLIDIIPKIVDTQRLLRIRDYEGAEAIVEVNKTIIDPTTGEVIILNDLSVGKYDVEADIKIWSTRREESVEGMREAMQYAPMIAPIIAKYYFKYADFPGAKELEDEINGFMKQQQQNVQTDQAIQAGAGVPENNGGA